MARVRAGALLGVVLSACDRPPPAPMVAIDPTEPTTLDTLKVVLLSDTQAGGAGLSYRYRWSVDGQPFSDGLAVGATDTAKGQEWTVAVVASDGEYDSPVGYATTIILNTPPTVELAFENDEPFPADDLRVNAHAFDADGDAVSLSWAWTVDGEGFAAAGSTVSASGTRQDQVWAVTVTPNDGEEDGEPVTLSVRIGNHAPEVTSAIIAPAEAYETTTLTATIVSDDEDGDEVALQYSWRIDGAEVSTAETLDGADFDKHDEVTLVVTPVDDWAEGEAVTSSAIAIRNTPPVIESAALAPAEIREASAVTCLVSSTADEDGDPVSLSYSWTVNGVVVATGESLTGELFAKGDEVGCTATPDDGEEDGDPVEAVALTVLNTAPELSSAVLSTTSPTEGDSLSVILSGGRDDDGDALRYGYAWYVDGALASTAAWVDGDVFDKGGLVYVVVTPSDGEDEGAAVTSDTATVVNTPPAVTSLSLWPDDVYTDDRVEVDVDTTDADGDAVYLSYAWYIDGTLATTSSALDGSTDFDKGDEIFLVVTPSDGDDEGDSATSDTVTARNTPPTAPEISISPAYPEETDDLLCVLDAESSDADGDEVTYTFGWEVDGTEVASAATTTEEGDTILAEETVDGELWTCTVTPDDGEEEGAGDSASVTVVTCGRTETLEGIEMYLACPGSFMMGSPEDEVSRGTNEDQHQVTLTHAFYIGVTEVTLGQWEEYLGYVPPAGSGFGDDYPSSGYRWHQAAAFANAVSDAAGLEECFSCTGSGTSVVCVSVADPYACEGYRLPTEAEWEYAARAGSTAAFGNGGNLVDGHASDCGGSLALDNGAILDDHAWYCGNTSWRLRPVAQFEPNAWGLYDMSGNVLEWVWDGLGEYDGDAVDPSGDATSSSKVHRGGDLRYYPSGIRVAARSGEGPLEASTYKGTRLARTAPE